MDLRINETLQIGAVKNSAYQIWGQSAFLFFEFTIELMRHAKPVRLKTAPTGGGLKAVRKPQLPGGESVYLFSEFTIMCTDFGIIPQADKAFKRGHNLPIKSTNDSPDETPREPSIFNIFS